MIVLKYKENLSKGLKSASIVLVQEKSKLEQDVVQHTLAQEKLEGMIHLLTIQAASHQCAIRSLKKDLMLIKQENTVFKKQIDLLEQQCKTYEGRYECLSKDYSELNEHDWLIAIQGEPTKWGVTT